MVPVSLSLPGSTGVELGSGTGIARSTFYDLPTAVYDDTAICDEFEFYGWRRVRAELRHRGMIVNHKKIRRLMRKHDLQPRRRRRHLATTDSDHDQPTRVCVAHKPTASAEELFN
jgi:HTH-like domain